MVRRLASWLVFPVVMTGAIAATILLMPALGPARAVIVAQTGSVMVIVLCELLLPHRREWLRSHGDFRTDALHALVSGVGTTQVARPLVQLLAAGVAAWLAAKVGGSLWPATWPLVVQLGVALVIAELPQYWLHRLQHEHDALWRFHAVHHSAPRLYWLNAARFHPVDLVALYVVGYLPLVVLGCPQEVFFLVAMFDAVFGMFQHCDVDVRLGPLNWIFSMAEPHRWHHSRTLAEANSNYGSNLIVWDHVFGTFFLPTEREPPRDIGIADLPRFPSGYLAQLAAPFRWTATQRESARVHDPAVA
jgi:sterol desaturase/sphingolipid hydroxylase (fatty acid hydroxylase superfamily)